MNLKVAAVSEFGKVALAGLSKKKKSVSYPSVLALLGILLVVAAPLKVILLLKKLSTGLVALLKEVKPALLADLILNWSPLILKSPSNAATPMLALTGPAGIVLNPE